MSTRNLINSNIWQIVSADTNNLPLKVYNQFIPLPTLTQVGGVRPDGTTITIDQYGVITAIGGGGGGGQYELIPYVTINSGPNPGTGFVFSNVAFLGYLDDASLMTVTANGVLLTPNEDYTLQDTQLTFNSFLTANTQIEVQAKVVPTTPKTANFVTTQSGDLLITQGGDFLILN